jgi:hypothetical protein
MQLTAPKGGQMAAKQTDPSHPYPGRDQLFDAEPRTLKFTKRMGLSEEWDTVYHVRAIENIKLIQWLLAFHIPRP